MINGATLTTKLMGVIARDFLRVPNTQAGVQRAFHSVFQFYGIDAQDFIFNLNPKQLPLFVESAKLLDMPGFGVTMPYKQSIVPYIDHLCGDAAVFQAVNLVIIKNGETFGYMTDGIGFCGIWDEHKYSFIQKHATIIGAGAISLSICYELVKRGVSSISIINRSLERAETTASRLHELTGLEAEVLSFEKKALNQSAIKTDILIQATSLGMTRTKTEYPFLDFLDLLPENAIVCDVITSPLETAFLKKARSRGLLTSDGADMLSYQMLPTMKYYFGDLYPFDSKVTEIAESAFRGR